MSKEGEFRRELDALYERRTDWLHHSLSIGKPGRPPKFSRSTVNEAIERLQQIASDALAKNLAKTEFSDRVKERHRWQVGNTKGHGRDAKTRTFKKWYRENVGHRRCIYVFWDEDRCLYVGKSTNGGGRIASHFGQYWFSRGTRIDVYAVSGSRGLPLLECLGIHRFQPIYNKSKAEEKKWTAKCPLCALHRDIETELRSIYRLRAG